MPTKTNNYMNWENVSATPQGGAGSTPIPIKEVTDVNPDLKTQSEKFYGDNRKYPKLIRPTQFEPSLEITTGDVGVANLLTVGQAYTVTGTLCDAFNNTGTGAITFTYKNAVFESISAKGPNNKFGMVTLHFTCFGDDSTAYDSSPVTYTVA